MQVDLTDALKRKYNENEESPTKKRWVRSILRDNYETSKYVNETLSECKSSRSRIEKSLIDTRLVINQWEDYSDEYQEAVGRLGKRIEDSEKEEVIKTTKVKKIRPKLHHSSKFVPSLAYSTSKAKIDIKEMKPFM